MQLENIGTIVVNRLAPQPGDTLIFTIKNDDIDELNLYKLRNDLKLIFPEVKVILFGIGSDDVINLGLFNQDGKSCNIDSCKLSCSCDIPKIVEGV